MHLLHGKCSTGGQFRAASGGAAVISLLDLFQRRKILKDWLFPSTDRVKRSAWTSGPSYESNVTLSQKAFSFVISTLFTSSNEPVAFLILKQIESCGFRPRYQIYPSPVTLKSSVIRTLSNFLTLMAGCGSIVVIHRSETKWPSRRNQISQLL